jgi:PAS domain S-box-containing protein
MNALLDAASAHAIITTDLSGTITSFNSGAEAMLGHLAADVIGRCTPEVFHDPHEVAVRADELHLHPGFEVFVAAARAGAVETRQWTYIAADRSRLRVSVSVNAIKDAQGQPTGFISVATDVTALEDDRRALDEQRNLYAALVEQLPATTVGLIDEDLRWLSVNGHYPASIGRRADYFIGRLVGDSLPPRNAAQFLEIFAEARRDPVHAEFCTPDGRHFEIDGVPLRAPGYQRRTPAILAVLRDVTHRRQAERKERAVATALALTERTFAAAFDRAPGPMVILSAGAGTSDTGGIVLQANEAFAQLLGRTRAELTGAAISDLSHPDDLHLSFARRSAPDRVCKRYIHASGEPIWVEVVTSPITGANGELECYVKHVTPLAALETAPGALPDDAAATISHQIRTPLTAIKGYLELMAEDENTLSEHRDALQIVLRNVDRLQGLSEQILAPEPEGPPFRPDTPVWSTVYLAEVVASAVDALSTEAAERGIELTVDLPAADVLVPGLPDDLYRVGVNLVSNAIKYSHPGATVTVRLDVPDGEVALLTVCDTGIGIPAAEHGRLFDRFYRASNARTSEIPGTGLGLAITKTIVDEHRGELAIDSQPGVGTTVTVVLPAADLARGASPAA